MQINGNFSGISPINSALIGLVSCNDSCNTQADHFDVTAGFFLCLRFVRLNKKSVDFGVVGNIHVFFFPCCPQASKYSKS